MLGQEAWERYKREHVTDDTALQTRPLAQGRPGGVRAVPKRRRVGEQRPCVLVRPVKLPGKAQRTAKVGALEAISEAYGVTFVIADGKTEVRLPGETPWRKPTSRS